MFVVLFALFVTLIGCHAFVFVVFCCACYVVSVCCFLLFFVCVFVCWLCP